jgi:anti-sigma regulatory factor (Ser/Thr protein kinase)
VALGNTTLHPTRLLRTDEVRCRRYELPACAASVAAARQRAHRQLSQWAYDADTCDTALLVVSELFTNAVTHTTSDVIVCVLRDEGDRLRVEVEDQACGAGSSYIRRTPDEERGRGLLLINALSLSWGVQDTRDGRAVWADVPRTAPHR